MRPARPRRSRTASGTPPAPHAPRLSRSAPRMASIDRPNRGGAPEQPAAAGWDGFVGLLGIAVTGRLPLDRLGGEVEDPGDCDGEDEADRQDHDQRSHCPVGRAEGGEHGVGDLGDGPRDRRVDGSGTHHLPTLRCSRSCGRWSGSLMRLPTSERSPRKGVSKALWKQRAR